LVVESVGSNQALNWAALTGLSQKQTAGPWRLMLLSCWYGLCFARCRMSTQAQFDARPEPRLLWPIGRGLTRGSKLASASMVLAVWVFAAMFLPVSVHSGIAAENQPSRFEAAQPGVLLGYLLAMGTVSASADSLWSAGHSIATESVSPLLRADAQKCNALFSSATEPNELASPSSLLIPPKTIASRFSYLSWARVHTGFGQFFESVTPRISRTNGAGTESPHWFYLKMSFRF
jgi:hypothetical protein